MIRAIDVANFFINLFKSYDDDNDLTNMKINKLLYFAQGHSYERFNTALFSEDIEAWVNGPVVNGIYQNLKKYNNNTVTDTIGEYDPSVFSDEENELLLDVAREYGKYSAATLRNMTHSPNTPWKKHYDGNYHTLISQCDIADYFMKGDNLPTFSFESVDEPIGYVEDGKLVLPKEELDDWTY